MEAVLQYRHVSIQYGSQTAIEDVSFAVHPGETVGIIGASGSGKSTLLNGAMHLLGPAGWVSQGTIWLQGHSLLETTETERQALYGTAIAMIFQDGSMTFAPMRTIGSQICEALAVHRGWTDKETKQKALPLFEKVALPDGEAIWRSYPFMLSGGMLQRAAIVLAMLLEPAVLLADEPTSALDVCAQQEVLQALHCLQQDNGTAIVLVTHDMAVIRQAADTVLVLHQGHCIERGTVRQILGEPRHDYTKALIQAMPIWRR